MEGSRSPIQFNSHGAKKGEAKKLLVLAGERRKEHLVDWRTSHERACRRDVVHIPDFFTV